MPLYVSRRDVPLQDMDSKCTTICLEEVTESFQSTNTSRNFHLPQRSINYFCYHFLHDPHIFQLAVRAS